MSECRHCGPEEISAGKCECAAEIYAHRIEPPSPELLARAKQVAERVDTRTEEQIIADGVAFVMGPGGDEGTRQIQPQAHRQNAERDDDEQIGPFTNADDLINALNDNDAGGDRSAAPEQRQSNVGTAASPAQPVAKRVPREPTQSMLRAAEKADYESPADIALAELWRAMYDAAPADAGDALAVLRELVESDNAIKERFAATERILKSGGIVTMSVPDPDATRRDAAWQRARALIDRADGKR